MRQNGPVRLRRRIATRYRGRTIFIDIAASFDGSVLRAHGGLAMHAFASRFRLAVAVVATLIASPLAVVSAIADGGAPSLAGVGQHVSSASDVDTMAPAVDAATAESEISGPI